MSNHPSVPVSEKPQECNVNSLHSVTRRHEKIISLLERVDQLGLETVLVEISEALKTDQAELLRLSKENQSLKDGLIEVADGSFESINELNSQKIEEFFKGTFSELKLKLEEKDDEIRSLKVNLADSVLEQKKAERFRHEALEESHKLKGELRSVQAKVRDLTLDLDSLRAKDKMSMASLGEFEEEVKGLKVRLGEAEDNLAEATEKLDSSQLLAKNLSLEKTSLETRIARDREQLDSHLDAVNRLKQKLEASFSREQELVDSIDCLQKEKNHLKDQISRLLTGVKQYVTQPSGTKLTSDQTSVLEPKEFAPFIPFCFPERLPSALKINWCRKMRMQEQERPVMRKFFHRTFHYERDSKLLRSRVSSSMAFRHLFLGGIPKISVPRVPLFAHTDLYPRVKLTGLFSNGRLLETFVESPKAFDSEHSRFAAIIYTKPLPLRIKISSFKRSLSLTRPERFEISGLSRSLFASYLAANILKTQSEKLKTIPMVLKKGKSVAGSSGAEIFIFNQNTFARDLDFRPQKTIQFGYMKTPRSRMEFCFKISGKLQAAIASFGKSLSDMYEKYSSLAKPGTDEKK